MTNTTFDDGRVPIWSQADALRKAREDSQLTQADLAGKLGVNVTTVRRMEAGARPKRITVMAWAMATGVSARWLEGQGWASWDLNPQPAD